jgi:sulfatase modifying factor 1
MLTQIRRKIVQKNVKKYSELRIEDRWDTKVGSHIFKYSHLCKQRYSKEKMAESFENLSLEMIPYYKVDNEIYNLILCTSGTFIKGSENSQDKNPIEEMKIEKAFLLGETEVTQELYQAVMGENPSHFKGAKNPVENVSWYDALIFCNRLSDIFDLDRYYTFGNSIKIGGTRLVPEEKTYYHIEMHKNSKGFRLPTEWEWEYAAKAGTQLKYSGSDNVDEVGWHSQNSYEILRHAAITMNRYHTTHPVKQKNPNAWGFYDMSGNVSEWCEDEEVPFLSQHFVNSPRRYRGGDFNSASYNLCPTHRPNSSSPAFHFNTLGFRVCKYI